jgi:hypothetical protein
MIAFNRCGYHKPQSLDKTSVDKPRSAATTYPCRYYPFQISGCF